MAELTAAQKIMLEAKRRAAEKRGEAFDMEAEAAKLAKPAAAKAEAEAAAPKTEAVAATAQAAPEAVAAPASKPAPAAAESAGADRIAAAKAAAAAKKASTPAAAPAPKPKAAAPAPEPEPAGQAGINRREFLTYAWGAALGLIAAQGGLATYQFMYPRFKEGEFGGKFPLGEATILPAIGTPPEANATGKFWLVQTDAGVAALYMVCTHLGCLYKWEASASRFECPCHGSKFTADGVYIEGPAPRSLDQFVVEIVENGEIVAETTDSAEGILPAPVISPTAQVVVDTGSKILGKSHG